MGDLGPNAILIFLGLGAILLELILGVETGFDLVLIGSALFIGGMIGNWVGSWQIGLGVAALLSLVYMVVGRKYLKEKFFIATHKSSVDHIIGKKGVVTKAITPEGNGQVQI